MRVTVLLNDSAGTVAKVGANGDAAEQVRQAMVEAGIDGEVLRVDPKAMRDAAQRAVDAPGDAVVAGGGDGTVNTVASAVVGSDKALGVLPLGTLNHFAKNLGMPLPLDEAVRALAAARVRAVDVGDVNGHLFINNASIGLYPHMVGKREELRRDRGHNKWVATVFAAMSAFHRFPSLRVRIVAEGKTDYCRTPFIFVGNNPYEVSLYTLGERPCLDRGVLGLYFAKGSGRFALLRLALRMPLNRLEQAEDFEAKTMSEFWVDTHRHRLHVATDGELHHLSPPLHFVSRPGALRVLAPPTFGASCRPTEL